MNHKVNADGVLVGFVVAAVSCVIIVLLWPRITPLFPVLLLAIYAFLGGIGHAVGNRVRTAVGDPHKWFLPPRIRHGLCLTIAFGSVLAIAVGIWKYASPSPGSAAVPPLSPPGCKILANNIANPTNNQGWAYDMVRYENSGCYTTWGSSGAPVSSSFESQDRPQVDPPPELQPSPLANNPPQTGQERISHETETPGTGEKPEAPTTVKGDKPRPDNNNTPLPPLPTTLREDERRLIQQIREGHLFGTRDFLSTILLKMSGVGPLIGLSLPGRTEVRESP